MFAIQIILMLVIVSGLIAFIGDRVGHQIGRKRLSIFGLRPRYTAIAVTVATGMLIALLSGLILFASSADVRTALFGLDNLKLMIKERSFELEKIKSDRARMTKELESISTELKRSKEDISILNKTKDKLSEEIVNARSGLVLFKINDVISSAVIEPKDKEKARSSLMELLAATDSIVQKIVGSGKKHYIELPNNELDEAVTFAADHKQPIIVRVVAAENAVFGESIPVHFELFENVPVFKKNEVIVSGAVNGAKSLPEIEQEIKDILSQVSEIAVKKGMIADSSGSVGNIPYSRIFEMTKAINARKKPVEIEVYPKKNISSFGPLDVDLRTM